MSKKKRKLNKAKETLQKTYEKHLVERRQMLRLMAFITFVLAAALAVRLYIIAVNFSITELCFNFVLLVVTYAGPILRVIWNNKQIRAIKVQIAEKDQQILDWSRRLLELE